MEIAGNANSNGNNSANNVSSDNGDDNDNDPENPIEEGEHVQKFVLSDFTSAVIQLLDLLMDSNFCHPYGTIAGSVA